ncbi:hypothetical protein [Streptomyces sp. NPDC002564]|uniref:hypothetical protein n=1 Tax=Streptomyces sp. NPDC002564 TaxID=3364649 RepID=UPI0036A2299D
MPSDEPEGPSTGARRGAGHRDAEGETNTPDELALLVGGLLIELGSKIRQAGIDGVRILTEEEAQQTQLRWFREGWDEHARAAEHARAPDSEPTAPAGHTEVDQPPGRLFQFPAVPPPRGAHPLPIVGTDEVRGTRDLMSHRPRRRREEPPRRRGHEE